MGEYANWLAEKGPPPTEFLDKSYIVQFPEPATPEEVRASARAATRRAIAVATGRRS